MRFEDYFTRNADHFRGEPLIKGTGIKLRSVLKRLAHQASEPEILSALPGLRDKDLRRVIAYTAASVLEQLPEPGSTRHETGSETTETSFEYLFQNNPLPMWVFDLKTWAYLTVNQAAIAHYGYTRDEFLSMTIKDIRPDRDVPMLKQRLAKAGPQLQNYGSWRHQKKNGEIIDVEVHTHDLDYEHRPARLVSIYDITKRLQAEKALRESEQRLELFFSQSLDGFFFMMLDQPVRWDDTVNKGEALDYIFDHHRVTKVNQAMLDQYGAREDQFIGMTLRGFFEYDLAYGKAVMRRFFDAGRLHIETEERKLDGTPVWIEGNYICFHDTEGRIIGNFGIQRDITQRKHADQSLQRYTKRLEAMQGLNRAILAARSTEQIAQVAMRHIEDLIPCLRASVAVCDFEKGGATLIAIQTRHKTKLGVGTVLPLESLVDIELLSQGTTIRIDDVHAVAVSPIYRTLQDEGIRSFITVPLIAQGELIAVLNLGAGARAAFSTEHEDIAQEVANTLAIAIQQADLNEQVRLHATMLESQVAERTSDLEAEVAEHKQTEEALRQAKEAAETANRAKSVFLANMSHELRTPLNSVLGYAQILKGQGELTDKQRKALNTIEQSGNHLLGLINEVLDLAKVEAGNLELYATDINLPDLLQEVVDIMQTRAKAKGLHFCSEWISEFPTMVIADERRLRQVLVNLLDNAIKYSDRGTVVLKVGHHSDRLRFLIEDTGIGIRTEDLKNIFNIFHQVHHQKRVEQGTGLGLAICQRLVNLMGGTLQVTSVPGEGSRFWFDLDLPSSVEYHIRPESRPRRIIGIKGPKRKVLIADDRADNRTMLRDMLQPLGFEVHEVCDGGACLQEIIGLQPDILLVDLRMPILNGEQVIQRVRTMPTINELPIIVISASAFEQHRDQCIKAGANDFLPKPFKIERLLECLQELLEVKFVFEVDQPQKHDNPKEIPHGVDLNQIALPSEHRTALVELARRGDVKGLAEQADKLAIYDIRYIDFAEEIKVLTEQFQVKKIRQILEATGEGP